MKKAKYKIGQKVWIIPDCSEKNNMYKNYKN